MKRNRTLLRCVLWGAVAAWMAVIFFFSAQNGEASSSLSGKVAVFLLRVFVPGFDGMIPADQSVLAESMQLILRKCAHVGVYAVLGILCFAAVNAHSFRRRIRVLLPPLLCLVFATSDELHQAFVPGRSPQFTDVFIDFGGSLTGIFLAAALMILFQRHRRKNAGCSAESNTAPPPSV